MAEKHKFRILEGFTQIGMFETTMSDAKGTATNIANKSKVKVRMEGYNKESKKWDYLGTYNPDGSHIDAFGGFHDSPNDLRNHPID